MAQTIVSLNKTKPETLAETIKFGYCSFFIHYLCKIKTTHNQKGCVFPTFKCAGDHQTVISSSVSGQTVIDNIIHLEKKASSLA